VANGREIFVELLARIELFKKKGLDTSLPQTPVISCWETWLDAIVYYAENCEVFFCG
jgi:hypothetical protein